MKFSKLLDSPLLFCILLLAVLSLSWAWYRSDSRNNAPFIPEYSWANHPDVAVIANESECCGITNYEWVKTALRNKADVLVISNHPDSELENFAKRNHHPRFQFLVTDDKSLIQFFSPGGHMAGARVVNGRVLEKVEGGIPPDFLFQPIARK